MIHVGSLPGTPMNSLSISQLVENACKEADLYKSAGVDGIIVENMNDLPYVQASKIGPEIVSSMTRICSEIRKVLPFPYPCGVQLLAGGNEQALAVALASDFDFIRAECFVFGHVADEGLMNACAGPLLRYRNNIGAENVLVLTDIKKKHSSHAITSDVDIAEVAKAAEFFLADGVIVTGTSTAAPVDYNELKMVKKATSIPVCVGSGVTIENVDRCMDLADAIIVGSHFKHDGNWRNSLDLKRIERFMKRMKK
ncbi:Uncharacterised protein g5370 [Pycnogonum litorale]